MDLVAALLFSFTLLLFSVFHGYFIAYPLLGSLVVLMGVFWRRGFELRSLIHMAYRSSSQSFGVIRILLLIGAVIAVWMAAGTIPALMYYGLKLLHPRLFILSAFVLTSLVSILLGTSFGTAGTIGVALMLIAKSSSVNLDWVAGAIIAGAYVGDRCSPMSSSAHLVATLTQTDIYQNIRQMIRTTGWPLLLSCGVYLLLSLWQPVYSAETGLTEQILQVFNLNPVVLLPALLIIILAIWRVHVQWSLLLSAGVGSAIALVWQQHSIDSLLHWIVLGFQLDPDVPLAELLQGGGLWAMAKVSLVVVISTALAGIIAQTKALGAIERLMHHRSSRYDLFCSTALISMASAAFGCTQAIAILLTQQLVTDQYSNALPTDTAANQLAIDLENTAVVLSPLVPWNIAGLVPATVLMTDVGYIPYAVYLYLLPLMTGANLYRQPRSRHKSL